jgi:hypothetical protein
MLTLSHYQFNKWHLLSGYPVLELWLYRKSVGIVWWIFKRKSKEIEKMKTLVNIGNGALVVTENAGQFVVAVSESASLGGGEAAGIVSVKGEATATVDGTVALKLAEAFANSKLPASIEPIASAVEGAVNEVVTSLE